MKFFELLKKHSNEEILLGLHKYYDDIIDDAYIRALNELRSLIPSKQKQDLNIYVSFTKNKFEVSDEKLYLECDGVNPASTNAHELYALEFDDWVDWLAKDVSEKSFETLDELTILAGIVYEITFNGYSQASIEKKRNNLEQIVKDVDEHPENLISTEDIKKHFNLE
jgi:hypothetical protein